MTNYSLTAIILTLNESAHIERCIRRLQPLCREVVVVDSHSTDNTVEIARGLGATVLVNKFVNYGDQFNWGLDHASVTTDWILRIDADEYLESGIESLDALNNADADVTGFSVNRRYHFLGQWIRHGAMYPIKTLRIFRTGQARVEQRWMDEHLVLQTGRAESLPLELVDDNLHPVSWWIQKHNGYATREMLDVLNSRYRFVEHDDSARKLTDSRSRASVKRVLKEKIYARLPLFVGPTLYFLYRYFLRLGFLDGRKGTVFHFMQGFWYRALVDVKVMEAKGWLADIDMHDAQAVKRVLAEKTGHKL